MESAYEHGIHLYCENGANLNTVSEETLEGLAKYRVRSVFVSLDGATQETYEQYRVGGDLARVIQNIEKINSFKKSYRSGFPVLTWQFIQFPHNRHEIVRARKRASELGMGFYTKPSWGVRDAPAASDGESSGGTTGPGLQAAKRRAPAGGRSNPRRYRCAQLWTGPQVDFDGEMLGCCVVKESWGAGNVFRSGLLPVMNGEKMRLARAMVLGQGGEREDVACTHCKTFRRMKEQDDWLTIREVNALKFLQRVRRLLLRDSRYYAALHNAALRWIG